MCVAFCWDEAADGFHASNNYTENSADEKNFVPVMKSFMVMKGDGVKC
jgi:hypothetical protein